MFSVLIFLAVLSLLVLFHEMGHFLAAKACNIYVDQFSIGMPPRIFGIRIGDTDYCVSALPIGGYVKMAGQEDAPLSEEERQKDYGHVPPERWFCNRPLWQRYIVLLAGPFMNLVLALLLYVVLAAIGNNVPEMEVSARIGKIEKGSPAESASLYHEREGADANAYSGPPDATGWQPGDIIVSVNGQKMEKYTDIFFAAVVAGAGKTLNVVLDRTNPDNTKTRWVSPVAPAVFGETEHPRFGVAPYSSALVQKAMPGMPAEKAGLQSNDIILRVNGLPVDQSMFVETTEQTPEGGTLDLTVDRNGQTLQIPIQPQTIGRILGLNYGTESLDFQKALPVISFISDELGKKTNIQRKDIITSVNGQPATIELLRDLELKSPGGSLHLEIERPAILMGLLQRSSKLTVDIPVDTVRAVGVELGKKLIHLKLPPSQWLSQAYHQSYQDLRQTIVTLRALIFGSVSPKMLGGPVMIFSATSQAAELGITWLIGITALISVNLAVFNLLPLPILDGGLVVLNTIEAVRRRPLSPKFQERFQQLGWLFIIALMLFVTWNDIGRLIGDLKP